MQCTPIIVGYYINEVMRYLVSRVKVSEASAQPTHRDTQLSEVVIGQAKAGQYHQDHIVDFSEDRSKSGFGGTAICKIGMSYL